MKKMKTLFEDAIKSKVPEKPASDCIYVDSDSDLPLVLGHSFGEGSDALDYIKNLGS